MASNSENNETTEGQKTHFGFKTVDETAKAGMVRDVFDSVADDYDRMNDVMSAGVHRIWKNSLIDSLNPRADMHLLDVAGGTGDIAFRFLEAAPKGMVTVADINAEMLRVGKKRAEERGFADRSDFVCADAQKLPLNDCSVDAYTIAFGIRNVTRVEEALAEAYRVLKPGGRFLCLEFSHEILPLFKKAYETYSFNIIPAMGDLVASDRESYQYLVESIRKFPVPSRFETMIQEAGFEQTSHRTMSFGVVALHSGWRL